MLISRLYPASCHYYATVMPYHAGVWDVLYIVFLRCVSIRFTWSFWCPSQGVLVNSRCQDPMKNLRHIIRLLNIFKHQDKHSRHKVVIENLRRSQKISEDLRRSQKISEDLRRSQKISEDLRRSQKISEDLRSNLANKTRTTSGHSLVKSRSWAAGASAGRATGAAQRWCWSLLVNAPQKHNNYMPLHVTSIFQNKIYGSMMKYGSVIDSGAHILSKNWCSGMLQACGLDNDSPLGFRARENSCSITIAGRGHPRKNRTAGLEFSQGRDVLYDIMYRISFSFFFFECQSVQKISKPNFNDVLIISDHFSFRSEFWWHRGGPHRIAGQTTAWHRRPTVGPAAFTASAAPLEAAGNRAWWDSGGIQVRPMSHEIHWIFVSFSIF